MKISDFSFDLPQELIAQQPVDGPRDHSRLMVVDRERQTIQDRTFFELGDMLREDDLLVFNDSKVFPGRLVGAKTETGGRFELLLLRREGEGVDERWEAMVGGRRIRPKTRAVFDDRLEVEVLEEASDNTWWVRFDRSGEEFRAYLHAYGVTPIPPYIKENTYKEEELRERYQTVYAEHEGSAAAPTAGLHFTPGLIDRLHARGVQTTSVTLHVGLGTFAPVKVDDVEEHKMHSEFATVSEEAASLINATHARDGRVIAVGTTSVRTLESFAQDGMVRPGSMWTDIFLKPGYTFQIVDGLVTNFHLPASTLLMLVSAFGGTQLIRDAYQHAIDHRYRFYSFGDAMFIL